MPNIRAKPLIIGSIAFLLVIAFAALQIPSLAHRNMQKQFEAAGFTEARLPKPEKRLNALRYSNITLDSKGDNAIDHLTVSYDIAALLFSGRAQTLILDGVYLSGDISKDGQLSLQSLGSLTSTQYDPAFQTLRIRNATLSLITAQLGGIRIEGDIQLQQQDTGFAITGDINSQQDQFELFAKLNGHLDENGQADITIAVENAKLERTGFKLTRASGQGTLRTVDQKPENTQAQIQAGGMSILGLPWQNANITLNHTQDEGKIYIEARSIGVKDIELSLEGEKTDEHYAWNGRLFSPNGAALKSYLSVQNTLPENLLDSDILNTDTAVEIIFRNFGPVLAYRMTDTENKTSQEGRLQLTSAGTFRNVN